jgi:prepilin-type N-terminal cleavage/methylation domain-containing protein
MNRSIRGFTIVELLIVIVVIAILAAISIVAYNGIQNRTNDTAVTSDLHNIGNKIAEFNVINERYPQNTIDLETINMRFNKSAYAVSPTATINLAFCSAGTQQYALNALSKSGKKFSFSSSGGLKEYPASTINDGLTFTNNSCSDVLAGSNRVTSGYVPSDTTTGPWRAWAGGN